MSFCSLAPPQIVNPIKSKRFQQTFNDSPGPGAYQTYEGSSNPSFGKKGTGGFASRSSRMPRFSVKSSPNPTSYELSRELTDRRDFNKQYSRNLVSKCPTRLSPSAHVDMFPTVTRRRFLETDSKLVSKANCLREKIFSDSSTSSKSV